MKHNHLKPIIRRVPVSAILTIWIALGSLFSVHAQANADLNTSTNLDSNTRSDLKPGERETWMGDTIGNGFHGGTYEAGITMGGGFSTRDFGGVRSHTMFLAEAYAGRMLGNPVFPDGFFCGNFELKEEIFGGAQTHPNDAYVTGETTLLIYDFATHTPFMPFFGVGLGAALTDIDRPDLSNKFEFDLQGTAGVHYFLTKKTALTVQYRFIHLSDLGITRPNQGVNESTFSGGVSWFF